MRLIRDWEKEGKGVWRWGEREIMYLSLHCHHRMTPALRWTAMKASLMFHNDCEGRSHKTVSTDHNFRREKRAEADSNRGPVSVYQPNALPLGQTGSHIILARLSPVFYLGLSRVLPFLSDFLESFLFLSGFLESFLFSRAFSRVLAFLSDFIEPCLFCRAF